MSETNYRVRVVMDEDGEWHDPDGAPLPGSREVYEANPILRLIDPSDDPQTGARREATYEEYCAYEGDPEQHIALGVVVDRQCPCCGKWDIGVEALWNIDFMLDSPEAQYVDWTGTAGEIDRLPGYLREVATDLLNEAKAERTLETERP